MASMGNRYCRTLVEWHGRDGLRHDADKKCGVHERIHAGATYTHRMMHKRNVLLHGARCATKKGPSDEGPFQDLAPRPGLEPGTN